MDKWHGRGAAENPANRFEKIWSERDPEWTEEDPSPRTEFFKDSSRTAINYFNSPDLGSGASLNPYRGCEHGCAYCYARPSHEYLGFSSGLDFERKIMVKLDLPVLLRKELSSPHWKPQPLMFSGITDVYQPVERRLQLTRKCLQVLAEFRNPAGMITKNYLVTRDIDVLQELAHYDAVHVTLSVTSLKDQLASALEPRASRPRARLAAIQALAKAGIPVGVNVAPIIPGLNDYEVPAILKAAHDAGALGAGYTLLRLPYAVKSIFESWLERHVPDAKDKVLNRIRETRGGKLYDSKWGARMRGEGLYAQQIARLFTVARRKAGFRPLEGGLRTDHFKRPSGPQLTLFEV
jgi:DNA repair photolyase